MNSGSSRASTLVISALEGHVFSRILSFLLSPREFTSKAKVIPSGDYTLREFWLEEFYSNKVKVVSHDTSLLISRVLDGRSSRKLKLTLTSDQVSTTRRFRRKRRKGVAIEYNQVQQSRQEEFICNSRSSIGRKRINEFPYLGSRDRTSSNRDPCSRLGSIFNSQSISTEWRKVMQAGVHLQLLVGAVGMERKMNSSVGLGRRWRHRWGTLGRLSAFSLPTRDLVHPLKRIGSLVSVGGHLTPSSIDNRVEGGKARMIRLSSNKRNERLKRGRESNSDSESNQFQSFKKKEGQTAYFSYNQNNLHPQRKALTYQARKKENLDCWHSRLSAF
ncbi:hypothetical protein VNO80_06744 [Phaseolus coccineus]|uniref:Uncharacterized protein n=1 Tax=Phaseolus coccineus TaxID=3886 RepID=A0AAN9RHV8_PHACN